MEALLREFSKWLATTPLSHTIQTVKWIIPTLQTIHILSVAVAFSSAALVCFRMFRLFERDEPLREVARRFLPWIWPVLAVLLVTGSLLIVGEPRRSLVNSAFYLKMALLLAAILLTAGLQASLAAAPGFWEKDQFRRLTGRVLATVSILVWCGILFAGRWIAYAQAG
jgi:putative copper export protein